MFNQERVFQKTIRTVLFLSIMNKNKDEKLITLLNSSKCKEKLDNFQFSDLSKEYLEKIKMANEGIFPTKQRKSKNTYVSPQKQPSIYEFKTEMKEDDPRLNPLKGKYGISAKTTAKKVKVFGQKESLNSFKHKTSNIEGNAQILG